MKFLIQVAVILVLALILAFFLPWWSVAIAGFVGGWAFHKRTEKDFLAGLVAVMVLWAVMGWLAQMGNDPAIFQRVSQLLPGKLPPMLLPLFAGLVGGLTAGFAAATGGQLRSAMTPKRRRRRY